MREDPITDFKMKNTKTIKIKMIKMRKKKKQGRNAMI
jgi:hypothetical protein